uniref:Putative Inhibitor of MCP methylation-like protein n=1 Tax=Magnetococcus massalia (strain MO-1) TaxID=451514 RepID=A0A1S7LH90_MAGMO|nr:putative Inhibitor of MCP methylation-like protein [Candidatus Magnetococcus massalia]
MAEPFIEALREAVQEIAESMLFVEVEQKDCRHDKSPMTVDISAILGYSENLRGSFALSAPTDGAISLASALLGEPREELDGELQDAYSEMANMLAGGVQSRMEAQFGAIKMSTPMLIQGHGHQVGSEASFQCVSHDFSLDGKAFCVHIFYHPDELEKLA